MKVFFVQFVFLKLERGALGWLELAVGLCLFDLCTHSENQHVYVHDFFSIKVNVLAMADQHLVAAVKAFRNCSPGGPESHKFLVADPDVLVENHEELCLELLQLERRMTISFLQSAIGKAFPRLTAGECTAWAQRLDAGLKHILLKKKQSTSGKKLNSSVWRIIQQLGPESPQAGVSSLSSSSRPSLASTSKKLFPPGIDPVLNAKTVLQKAKAALGDDSFEDEEMPDKSSASVVSVASSEQEYQQYFDNASMCMVRLLPSGQLVQSIMKPGENGFAVATFHISSRKRRHCNRASQLFASKLPREHWCQEETFSQDPCQEEASCSSECPPCLQGSKCCCTCGRGPFQVPICSHVLQRAQAFLGHSAKRWQPAFPDHLPAPTQRELERYHAAGCQEARSR